MPLLRSLSWAWWSLLLVMGCALTGHAGAMPESATAVRARIVDAVPAGVDRTFDEGTPAPRVHDDVTDLHKRRRVGAVLHAESPVVPAPVTSALSLFVTQQAMPTRPSACVGDGPASSVDPFPTRRLLRACRGRAPPRC